jgi:GAF domain-containing protein
MPIKANAHAASGTSIHASLRRVTRAIHTHKGGREEVLNLIAEEARRLIYAERVVIGLREEHNLHFVAVAGEKSDELVDLRIGVHQPWAEATLRTGRSRLLNNRGNLKPSPSKEHSANPIDTNRTAVVVPISRNGHIAGVILGLNKQGDKPFTHLDADILAMLAEHVNLVLMTDELRQKSAQQSRELALLHKTARSIGGNLDLQAVFESVLDAICEHLEYQAVILFLLNDERTHLFIAADSGLREDEREFQLAADGRVTAALLEGGRPLLLDETHTLPDLEDVTSQSSARSALIAPILSHHGPLGLILVTSAQPKAYTEGDLNLLAAVAAQAGIAIENAWVYEEATRCAEETSALYDLSQHVNATLTPEQIYRCVADSALNLLKVDKFALLLMDRQAERLVTHFSWGVNEESFHRIQPRVGEGIAGWVYEWQTPTAVADVAADSRNRSAPIHTEGVTSVLCAPMAVGDEVMGVLLAMSSHRRLFTVGEMELLYTIANQAAVAIVNASLYQEARAKSEQMRRYVHRVARAFGEVMEGRELPQLLADLVVEMMQVDRCAIYRLEGNWLHLLAARRFRASMHPDRVLALGQGLAGTVARRGKALMIEDLAKDPRALAHSWLAREPLSSYLGIALKVDRRTVGVLEIYTHQPRLFTPDEIKLLAQFAKKARVAERLEGLSH